MTDYVALFRGINVGGKHILPMQELRDLLTALGCDDIKTIIHSGNAVFSAETDPASLSLNIANAIDEKFTLTDSALYLFAPAALGQDQEYSENGVYTYDHLKVIDAVAAMPDPTRRPDQTQWVHKQEHNAKADSRDLTILTPV